MRILKGSDFVLSSPTFVGGADFETATATTGTPTVTVTTANGTVLATPSVTTGPTTGVYRATLTAAAHTTNLETLVVTWTGTAGGFSQNYRQIIDVAGAHYVTLPEIRSYPDLNDKTKFPAYPFLSDIRDEYEELIERVCGVAFVPLYSYETHTGNNKQTLKLNHLRPRTIRSVTIDGVAYAASNFDFTDGGILIYVGNTFSKSKDGTRNITVGYEYGYDLPPAKIRREFLKCVRAEALALKSAVPNNAISQSFEGVTIRYSTPDPSNNRPTGILTLDPVLVQYSERIPGIA